MSRKILQNALLYLDFQSRNIAGVVFSPQAKENIETVHYLLEHNLPVQKQLLYEVFPEYFEEDIGKLEKEQQQLVEENRPHIAATETNTIQMFQEDGVSRRTAEEPEHFIEKIFRQEEELREFIFKETKRFHEKHYDHLILKIKSGYYSVKYILLNIETRDRELLTTEELEIFNDLQELKQLQRDLYELKLVNKQRRFNWQRELQIPEFIKQSKNTRLKEYYIQRFHEIVTPSFNIEDVIIYILYNIQSIMVPEGLIGRESMFDKIL